MPMSQPGHAEVDSSMDIVYSQAQHKAEPCRQPTKCSARKYWTFDITMIPVPSYSSWYQLEAW